MKISLAQQIDEVERELKFRAVVYPRQVQTHKMRESIAEFQTNRMQAVLDTLKWLQANEDKVRAAMGVGS